MYPTKADYKEQYRKLFYAYPLAVTGPMQDIKQEYAKMSVVAYVISREINASMFRVIEVMCELRDIKTTNIPGVKQASRFLGLRDGFIDDWEKIAFLKQGHKEMAELEQLIINYSMQFSS